MRQVALTHPRILMYHMVREPIPGARFNGLRVAPDDFAWQLSWLRERDFTFRFLSELLSRGPGAEQLPPRTCVLTFDDGYADNLHHALPIMQRYDAVATLYLVQHRHDNDWSVKKKAHHDSGELAREAKLSDDEVAELLASGRFELGGHSATHADFSKLSIDERRREIVESKAALEKRFGVTLATHAYPFGIYDATDAALVREAGFSGAVTTREGISRDLDAERFELRRIKVSGRKGRRHFRRSLGLGLAGWW